MSPKPCYQLVLSRSACRDLEDILAYTAQHHSPKAAYDLLDRIQNTMDTLKSMPERGHTPPEMNQVQIYSFREVHSPPYRVIYEIAKESHRVMVHCLLDSRRSLAQILYERLIR